MEYQTVFEISDHNTGALIFLFLGVISIAIGILFEKYPSIITSRIPPPWGKRIATYWLGFSLLLVALLCSRTIPEYYTNRKQFDQGKFKLVEGIVENFDPMPVTGHKEESFTVKGIKFEYSDYIETPGFHKAAALGGPLREGLPVRISYIGNVIVKLEIAGDKKK